MDQSQRVITELPLQELWDDGGPVDAKRTRDLGKADLQDMFKHGPIRFVLAEVGAKPQWVPQQQCVGYWKTEVCIHLAEPEQRVSLANFPGCYCYFASEWLDKLGTPVVVLERIH